MDERCASLEETGTEQDRRLRKMKERLDWVVKDVNEPDGRTYALTELLKEQLMKVMGDGWYDALAEDEPWNLNRRVTDLEGPHTHPQSAHRMEKLQERVKKLECEVKELTAGEAGGKSEEWREGYRAGWDARGKGDIQPPGNSPVNPNAVSEEDALDEAPSS